MLAGRTRDHQKSLFVKHSIAMISSGAVLGPCCDGLHSRNDVLHYSQPIVVPILDLETCWWVPLLFGLAGWIIGLGVPLLDSAFDEEKAVPGWKKVFLCISTFVICYFLSAKLDALPMAHEEYKDLALWGFALTVWWIFDRTRSGFVMSALTALSGPLIEVFLIGMGLYTYTHPSTGLVIPTWISPVYFCGGPAVGLLGRKVLRSLSNP